MEKEKGINRKYVSIAGSVLLLALIILIFFSKTIYAYNQATVTAVTTTRGSLQMEESLSGVTNWADIKEMYAELAGTVEEVLVAEGDYVREGAPLYKIKYDIEAIHQKLEELDISKRKSSLELEKIYAEMAKNTASINELNAENYEEWDEITSNNIELQKMTVKNARNNFNDIKDEGFTSGDKEYDDARETLRRAQISLDNAIISADNVLEDKETSREKQLKTYQETAATLQRNLRSWQLDSESTAIQQKNYEKQLADFEEYSYIKAPMNGTLITVPVKEGQNINTNALLATFGIGSEFKIECSISADNSFIAAGDICSVEKNRSSYEGTVTKITSTDTSKTLLITVYGEDITAGETYDITFSKETSAPGTLLSNSAVRKDSDGYFVYLVKNRKSFLGNEYYIAKSEITIGDNDDDNTVITDGINPFDVIVTITDKSISEGEPVKLNNAGDFFAS